MGSLLTPFCDSCLGEVRGGEEGLFLSCNTKILGRFSDLVASGKCDCSIFFKALLKTIHRGNFVERSLSVSIYI